MWKRTVALTEAEEGISIARDAESVGGRGSGEQADCVEGGYWIGERASRVLSAVGKHGWKQLIVQNTEEGSLNVST